MKFVDFREAADFLAIMSGNFLFYIYLARLIEWGKTKRVLIGFLGYNLVDWQFHSFFWYVAGSTLVTLPFVYFANLFFNYGYIDQGVETSSQWLSQIMTWGAAPLTFIIFAFIFGIDSPGVLKIGLIMFLLLLMKVVMMSKI